MLQIADTRELLAIPRFVRRVGCLECLEVLGRDIERLHDLRIEAEIQASLERVIQEIERRDQRHRCHHEDRTEQQRLDVTVFHAAPTPP